VKSPYDASRLKHSVKRNSVNEQEFAGLDAAALSIRSSRTDLSVFQPLRLPTTRVVCVSAMWYGEVEAVTLKVDWFLNVTRIRFAQGHCAGAAASCGSSI